MKSNGPLILLLMSLGIIAAYFYFYGFSKEVYVRWGQYAGIAMVVYFLIDEFFKE